MSHCSHWMISTILTLLRPNLYLCLSICFLVPLVIRCGKDNAHIWQRGYTLWRSVEKWKMFMFYKEQLWKRENSFNFDSCKDRRGNTSEEYKMINWEQRWGVEITPNHIIPIKEYYALGRMERHCLWGQVIWHMFDSNLS